LRASEKKEDLRTRRSSTEAIERKRGKRHKYEKLSEKK